MTASTKLYWQLIIVLALLAAINVFLPNAFLLNGVELPAPKPVLALGSAVSMLVIYGGLGWVGRHLATKLGIPDLLDESVSNHARYWLPLYLGIACGVFFILADLVLRPLHGLGALPHPEFPASLVASATAGIGEEVIFRLFLIPFWVWIISHLILKGRHQSQVFWVIAVLSAIAFAVGHLPSVTLLLDLPDINSIPFAVLFEVFLLNGVLSILAAWLFLRAGILAAIGVHFWTDIVWHVIYGPFTM